MKKAKLTIHGMHCASCASNIERSLGKIKGMKKASVSLMLKKATVEYDNSVSDEDLKTAVKRAGYEIKSIEYE